MKKKINTIKNKKYENILIKILTIKNPFFFFFITFY